MPRSSTLVVVAALLSASACDAIRPITPESTDPDLASLRAPVSNPTPSGVTLDLIGSFKGAGPGAAEITAFDEVSKRLFVVNGLQGTVDVLDLKNPSNPTKISAIQVGSIGAGANSVATHSGIVAVAIQAHVKTDPGTVAFYRASTLQLISSVTVGAQPDMVVFTPAGDRVLTANEGEPNAEDEPTVGTPGYSVDPEGSVSIIDVQNINRPSVRTAGFTSYNGQANQLRAAGVRIFGPNATVAQDLEPEYIAFSDDGGTAYVTLQENNALATVDVESAMVTAVLPLGFKDHSLAGNGFDASDRDGVINIRTWPVFGMYMPDAIAAYEVGGQTYLVTANEGDAREWGDYTDEERVRGLGAEALNPVIFSDAVCGGECRDNSLLGRLNVTTELGQNPETGQYDALYAYGARSFSIWTESASLVWDSGDDFEQRTRNLPMAPFNAGNDDNNFDSRSDNKGPEPEGVVVGKLGSKTFAFIGLERIGGVMVYDVTNPAAPFFVTYANTRSGLSGDRGPEGLAFVSALQSPNKRPLLIVGNELSGTTAIFEIVLY